LQFVTEIWRRKTCGCLQSCRDPPGSVHARRPGRTAHDELRLEEQFARRDPRTVDLPDEQVDRRPADRLDRLPDGGQRDRCSS